VIKGQPQSKANSRQLVHVHGKPLFIKSPEARAYEKNALLQIPMSARLMLDGRIRITIHIYYESERPDLDESIILDVLQNRYKKVAGKRMLLREGVYVNDRQVREKHIYHHIDKDNPRAEILVETVEEETPNMFAGAEEDVTFPEIPCPGCKRPFGRPKVRL